MKELPTYELDNVLDTVEPENYELYRQKYGRSAKDISISEYYNTYMGEHNLELSEVVQKSDIPSNYAYGILNGNRKKPSRDRVIALCLACEMDITYTNRALKIAGHNPLYSKIDRDAAIIIMINKGEYSVHIINEFLYGHNLDTLKTSSTDL